MIRASETRYYSERKKKAKRQSIRQVRQRPGSLLVLIACMLAALLVFVMIPFFNFWKLALARQSQLSVIEAASLAAARDLSEIVIEDPHFGFISLSDHPPIGRATIAPDGEPSPVTGINTIVGTCRLEMLIACAINNDEMKRLALRDTAAARTAAERLSIALTGALNPASGYTARDMNGTIVRPFESARQVLQASQSPATMAGVPVLKKLKLSLGWLKEGGSTQTPIPQPYSMAQLPERGDSRQTYQAFVDLPVDNESFFFAGLSRQPCLVDISQFRNPDRSRICSVVKAEADIQFFQSEPLHIAACAQPGAMPETNPPGVMVISFPNGLVPELRCVRDLIDNRQLARQSVQLLRAERGDFPDDPRARLSPSCDTGGSLTLCQVFAGGIYDWIRTAHARPRIDAILEMLDRPFNDPRTLRTGTIDRPYLAFEFDRYGRIHVTNLKNSPFMRQTVHENQRYALGLNAITFGECSWTLSFRDQVSELGLLSGGRHAGQSLPGEPVNWCELEEFNSSPDSAAEKGKGSRGLGLNVVGCSSGLIKDSVSLASAFFVRQSDGVGVSQARKSYYSGGMAVEFVVSSPSLAKL
ncbi:MAG: hypothetical protein K2X93_16825 [Candidatus Obscuribacterales bacterium]|nr:hypothetical protein [Candidatus Obscuribacterales bacterium]